MTENVTPVIEAMARAMCEDWGDEWETPTEKGLSVEAHQFYYLELAKAAAKVLIEECALLADLTEAANKGSTTHAAGVRMGAKISAEAIRALRSEMGIE